MAKKLRIVYQGDSVWHIHAKHCLFWFTKGRYILNSRKDTVWANYEYASLEDAQNAIGDLRRVGTVEPLSKQEN